MDGSTWREHIAPLGAIEAFAKSGKLAKRVEYISKDVRNSVLLNLSLINLHPRKWRPTGRS
jgi:hypothetical protein